MTEKRYYEKEWEESYYIFDSNTISEDEFEERVEYEEYGVFGDSLTGDEVIDLLNENEQLKEEFDRLKRANKKLNKLCIKYSVERSRLEEENKNLEIEISAKEALIDVCEKKFKELGYMISCDDDGYIVEDLE